MKILGIDPGKKGGFAIISEDGVMVEPMPELPKGIDLNEVRRWMSANIPDFAFLEEVHAIFKSSAGATFSFGRYFGAIEGVLHGLCIPYQLVQPKTWQKEMHQGISGKMAAKDKSRMAAARLFPSLKLTEGEMDALLIAEYGRRVTLKPHQTNDVGRGLKNTPVDKEIFIPTL